MFNVCMTGCNSEVLLQTEKIMEGVHSFANNSKKDLTNNYSKLGPATQYNLGHSGVYSRCCIRVAP